MDLTSITLALALINKLLEQVSKVSAVVASAVSEGRSELTDEEWAAVVSADDAAREALVEALRKKREEGEKP